MLGLACAGLSIGVLLMHAAGVVPPTAAAIFVLPPVAVGLRVAVLWAGRFGSPQRRVRVTTMMSLLGLGISVIAVIAALPHLTRPAGLDKFVSDAFAFGWTRRTHVRPSAADLILIAMWTGTGFALNENAVYGRGGPDWSAAPVLSLIVPQLHRSYGYWETDVGGNNYRVFETHSGTIYGTYGQGQLAWQYENGQLKINYPGFGTAVVPGQPTFVRDPYTGAIVGIEPPPGTHLWPPPAAPAPPTVTL